MGMREGAKEGNERGGHRCGWEKEFTRLILCCVELCCRNPSSLDSNTLPPLPPPPSHPFPSLLIPLPPSSHSSPLFPPSSHSSPHVNGSIKGVPADDAPCNVQGKCKGDIIKFDFRRLGLRSAAMLISPLVAKGAVFQVRGRRREGGM